MSGKPKYKKDDKYSTNILLFTTKFVKILKIFMKIVIFLNKIFIKIIFINIKVFFYII